MHICLVCALSLSYLARLFCISLCVLLRDPPRLSYALMDGPLMQSSHGAGVGHEMKRSLYQLGMSTDNEGRRSAGGRGEREKEALHEDRGERAQRGSRKTYTVWSEESPDNAHAHTQPCACKHCNTHATVASVSC